MQTVRQVQVLLEEVYVSLQAEEELPLSSVDRRLYEYEIKAIQEYEGLEDEEREDLLENLQAQYYKEDDALLKGEPLGLAELTRNYEKLVILGDPGAGKTTLMRYLALRHAQAIRLGIETSEELGKVCLPLYLRIADYAEHSDGQSMEDYLPMHICGKNHPDKALLALITGCLSSCSK
jgi:predicted NACHT family NTPase